MLQRVRVPHEGYRQSRATVDGAAVCHVARRPTPNSCADIQRHGVCANWGRGAELANSQDVTLIDVPRQGTP